MKKITTKIQLALVIASFFINGCSYDGTFSFSENSGTNFSFSNTLFLPISTNWSVVDSSKWYGYSENNFRYLRAKFVSLNYDNAVKVIGFVTRIDTTDSIHAMPYDIEGYKTGIDAVFGELYIQNPAEDYSSFYPLSNNLKFRVIIVPVDKLSPDVDINDYNDVCAYYNIEP